MIRNNEDRYTWRRHKITSTVYADGERIDLCEADTDWRGMATACCLAFILTAAVAIIQMPEKSAPEYAFDCSSYSHKSEQNAKQQ